MALHNVESIAKSVLIQPDRPGGGANMTRSGIARHTCVFGVLILILVLLVVPSGAGTSRLKFAFVFPGIVTDKSWNEAGYEGFKLVQKELGVQAAYIERVA